MAMVFGPPPTPPPHNPSSLKAKANVSSDLFKSTFCNSSLGGDPMRMGTIECANDRKPKTRDHPTALRVDDIPGAAVGTAGALLKMKYTNKPTFFKPGDIHGASPKKKNPPSATRPKYGLTNNDIEMSCPQPHSFVTKRHTDPNNPEYHLPSVEEKPFTPPKQLGDSMDIRDIAGTRPKPLHRSLVRDNIGVSDIDGTEVGSTHAAKCRNRSIPSAFPNEEVQRINHEGHGFKSNRTVNPLSPRYDYDNPEGGVGAIAGCHPRHSPKGKRPSIATSSLRTQDIDGARPRQTHGPINRRDSQPPPHGRVEPTAKRSQTDVSDIELAQPSSKHTGFHNLSGRHLDPLNPDYRPLGWGLPPSNMPKKPVFFPE